MNSANRQLNRIRGSLGKRAQWRRNKLAAETERIHKLHGGIEGPQDTLTVVKNALKQLEADGEVLKHPDGYGMWWRKA